jgi:septal ring factor EnvC (AmiA/AmiB activator)
MGLAREIEGVVKGVGIDADAERVGDRGGTLSERGQLQDTLDTLRPRMEQVADVQQRRQELQDAVAEKRKLVEEGRRMEEEVEVLEQENEWLRGEVERAERVVARRAAVIEARRAVTERARAEGVRDEVFQGASVGRGPMGRGRGQAGVRRDVGGAASVGQPTAERVEDDFEFVSSDDD